LGCGGIVEIQKGRYAGTEGHKPEYESIGAFGGLLLQDDLDAIIEMNEMCNRAGLDTISAGAAIAFAIECFEKGILFLVDQRFPLARRMVKDSKDKIARKVKRYVAGNYYAQLIHCGGCCVFGAESSTYPLVEYYNAVTGWDLSPDDYLNAGKRILCLRRAFNAREGIRPGDAELPPRAIGRPPMTQGPLQNMTVDLEYLEKVFLETVGWDPVTGAPTPETMREVGLEPFT